MQSRRLKVSLRQKSSFLPVKCDVSRKFLHTSACEGVTVQESDSYVTGSLAFGRDDRISLTNIDDDNETFLRVLQKVGQNRLLGMHLLQKSRAFLLRIKKKWRHTERRRFCKSMRQLPLESSQLYTKAA